MTATGVRAALVGLLPVVVYDVAGSVLFRLVAGRPEQPAVPIGRWARARPG